jgi:hypothetical protein
MTELALFSSTFILVFALGFQSLNVNNGHYVAAFMTSFAIGGSNLVLFKYVPDANVTEILAYLIGGPFGIVASMWAHRRWMPKKSPGPVPKQHHWPDPPRTSTNVICPKHERGGGPCYCPRV